MIFAWTPAGAQAIVNVAPVENGNVLLLAPTGFGLLAITLSKDALERAQQLGVPLRLSHWADCPDKVEWRERQAAKKRKAEG